MNRWIKYTAFGVVGVAVTAAAALALAAQMGERKMHRRLALEVREIALPTSAGGIERGRYLFMSRGCADCHGADGAGRDLINDGKGMFIHAPNITPSPGSATARYAAVDWVRTLRHGVKPNGEPVMVMPSEDYNGLTDADLAAVVGFVRQLPPVEAPGATVQLPLPVKALYAVGVVRDAYEKIDHARPPAQPIPEGVTPEHGAYVANACIGCHGASLSGGKMPGTPPDWPPAANLTPAEGSALTRYPDAASFVAMLRTGKRPDGSAVSPVMPFSALKAMSDTDVQALYLHLKRLAPVPTGQGR